jgi:hypothetical protein
MYFMADNGVCSTVKHGVKEYDAAVKKKKKMS